MENPQRRISPSATTAMARNKNPPITSSMENAFFFFKFGNKDKGIGKIYKRLVQLG